MFGVAFLNWRTGIRRTAAGIASLFFAWAAAGQNAALQLSIDLPQTNGWVRIRGDGPVDSVLVIQASADLKAWRSIAQLLDRFFTYVDAESMGSSARFYRLTARQLTASDDWKSQILFPQDRFLSPPGEPGQQAPRWVKFAILADDPARVYFQDSSKYLFHYDFAVARLDKFKGMTREAFDQISMHRDGQQAILGAVLFPANDQVREFGIQFAGLDAYPIEQIVSWFKVVESAVVAESARAFYIPSFHQAQAAEAGKQYLQQHGIELASADRWSEGDGCYAPGWAIGTLKFFRTGEIEAAYADGRLRPGDVLITDAVPAELPFLAGIISLSPSTPNSHVAILATSYGVPFVYVADEAERQRLLGLAGKEVAVRANLSWEGCSLAVVDTSNSLASDLKNELLQLKQTRLTLTPMARLGDFSRRTDTLAPADIKFFGGKAANYGLLRRSIPDSTPAGIAFSFDLWNAFLDQMLPGGITLRKEIQDRLARHAYPPSVATLKEDLAAIRDLITRTAQFTPSQRELILQALGQFNPQKKIRFRSSTNVEDSSSFSGAGLYDSYSGCLADDLDSNGSGPSLCDNTEPNERGVFRAMQKVYASFYNDNAVLERLRHQVTESDVGMGILVHHSYPDEIEWANGVATIQRESGMAQGKLVTQSGAVSVANPEGNARPEIVSVSKFSFGTYFTTEATSSLVPLGGHVLNWETDYRTLMDLFELAGNAYQQATGKEKFVLDFEYKKIAPGTLVVKQVREVPSPASREIVPVLFDQPSAFGVFQGEFGDVFANHRLKSRWQINTTTTRLTTNNLGMSFYADTTWEHVDGGQLRRWTGPPSTWPGATHRIDEGGVVDAWTSGEGKTRIDYELATGNVPKTVPSSQSPLVFLDDFELALKAAFAEPAPTIDYQGAVGMTNVAWVRLAPLPQRRPDDLLQQRSIKTVSGPSIRTSYYWPKPPGFSAGYTAPLVQWNETRLEGFTAEPIVLKGYYSQTYRPAHHNFHEEFIFEPRLEEGISPAALEELALKNIQLIHVITGIEQNRVVILGLDGKFRVIQ